MLFPMCDMYDVMFGIVETVPVSTVLYGGCVLVWVCTEIA